jgi:hypothetical protein
MRQLHASKEVGLCDVCGDTVVVPPGTYYRGLRMHKHCARYREQQDISVEMKEPIWGQIKQEMEELLENMQ